MNLPHVAAAVLDDQQRGSAVTCPMCHTPTSLTQSDIDAGEGWRCARCGQRWSATRLSTVAAYAASIADQAAAVVGATGGKTVLPRIVAPELRSGKP